jgi:hypothetical protein
MSEAGLFRRTREVFVGGGVALWAVVLLYAAYQIPLSFDIQLALLAVLTLCLVLAEWPWRNRGMHVVASALRGVVVVSALVWLATAMDTYSIVRNGFSEVVAETDGQQLDPFMSGVWTMKAAIDRTLSWAGYPIFLLTVQAVAAGLRSLFVAYREGPREGTVKNEADAGA